MSVGEEEDFAWVIEEVGGAQLAKCPPSWIPEERHALVDPPMVTAAEAGHMRDDDVVLGLSLGGEARAYPWFIMDGHHVANDTVAGRHVLVSLCEACCTGVAFDAVVDDRRLTFSQTYVYNGTTAVQDHETGSAWSPYFGRAIKGPLEGAELRALPICHMEWGDWRKLHPETLVLPDEPGSREGHGSECTIDVPYFSEEFGMTVARRDARLTPHVLVLGVVTPAAQRVYTLDLLRESEGVVNDLLGAQPIVALLHVSRGSYAALAFSRELDGRTLRFGRSAGVIVDHETGSEWTVEGRAISGPLAGRQLTWINSHVSRWYLWPAHYPDVQVASEPGQ